MNFKVTKTQVECYKIRSDNGLWADITIDDDGNKGRIQIASDYGDWQYYWNASGEPFKKFLMGLNKEYVANKFRCDKYFDLQLTTKRLIDRANEYYEDPDEKQEVIDDIIDIERNTSCKEEFVHLIQDKKKIMEMEDGFPELSYTISPSFISFWNFLWPAFINELRDDLIDEWHNNDSIVPLYEYLGMTKEQYEKWVTQK